MLENYTIKDNQIICNKCQDCYEGPITNEIIDIHDSYNIVIQFLLLNEFTKDKFECSYLNHELRIWIMIYIDSYGFYNDDIFYLFKKSSELLDYLKYRLDTESRNKITIIKNE